MPDSGGVLTPPEGTRRIRGTITPRVCAILPLKQFVAVVNTHKWAIIAKRIGDAYGPSLRHGRYCLRW
jgi:hypothetical protein